MLKKECGSLLEEITGTDEGTESDNEVVYHCNVAYVSQ
jgi:hypothetical protein